MKKVILVILLGLLLFSTNSNAQDSIKIPARIDKFTLGLGMGLDYGGFGGNLLFYPQKNIGIFAGVGYALAGMGYNFGTKLRLVPNKPTAGITPFLLAMYGYNAAIAVSNAKEYNKLFYGFSAGIGFDTRLKPTKSGYWSFALIVPFRGTDVTEYMDDLKQNHGVEFKNDLLPVAISIGYRLLIE